jgi:hypothetical protein
MFKGASQCISAVRILYFDLFNSFHCSPLLLYLPPSCFSATFNAHPCILFLHRCYIFQYCWCLLPSARLLRFILARWHSRGKKCSSDKERRNREGKHPVFDKVPKLSSTACLLGDLVILHNLSDQYHPSIKDIVTAGGVSHRRLEKLWSSG